ncbi:MAG: glycosyltransferase family A protein [Aliarcobacter butzleri]|nr:glycosyltransferase family A protein [Aliarcobacter butzleri]
MKEVIISIIIPTFGRAQNLSRAINSILKQTFKEYEIIVVDDNEPDSIHRTETAKIINTFDNEKIIYIQHEMNKNGAAARNTGIQNAKGEYIAFLDDDDEFEEDKLNVQYQFIKNNPSCDGVYSRSSVYKNGIKYYETKYSESNVDKIHIDLLSLKSECYTPTLFLKRKSLIEIGGFDESFQRNQDIEMLVRFTKRYNLCFVDLSLVKVHTDDNSNQLSFEKYEFTRNKFINKYSSYIDCLSENNIKIIYRELYFDLAYYAFKRKHFSKFLYYLFKSKPNIEIVRNNINKIKKICKKLFIERLKY